MARRLTPAQVAGIASQGTPPGTTVAEWVAKSRQESSHIADRIGMANRWDVGLWQVNVRANRDLITEASVSLENARSVMQSPLRNWEVSKQIYARQGWAAWRASGGKPRPNAEDRAAANSPDFSVSNAGGSVSGEPEAGVEGLTLFGIPLVEDVAKAIAAGVQMVADGVEWLTDTHNIIRLVYVGGGLFLAITGTYVIARPAVEPVIRDAKSAAKAVT